MQPPTPSNQSPNPLADLDALVNAKFDLLDCLELTHHLSRRGDASHLATLMGHLNDANHPFCNQIADMEHQHERADVYEIAVVFSDGYEALVTTTLKPPRQGPNGQIDTRSVKLQVRGPSRRTVFVRSYD